MSVNHGVVARDSVLGVLDLGCWDQILPIIQNCMEYGVYERERERERDVSENLSSFLFLPTKVLSIPTYPYVRATCIRIRSLS